MVFGGSKFTETYGTSFPVSGGRRTASVSEISLRTIFNHRSKSEHICRFFHNIRTTIICVSKMYLLCCEFLNDRGRKLVIIAALLLHSAYFNMAASLMKAQSLQLNLY